MLTDNAERSGGDMVSVMTLHAAKGLEFHTVFLPLLFHMHAPSALFLLPIAAFDVLHALEFVHSQARWLRARRVGQPLLDCIEPAFYSNAEELPNIRRTHKIGEVKVAA